MCKPDLYQLIDMSTNIVESPSARQNHSNFLIMPYHPELSPIELICVALNSQVSIAKYYGLDGRGSIPGRSKRLFFSTLQRLGPTQPFIQWVPGAFSREVKRPGREVDHSPPSSAEVKDGGTIPSLPHTSSWRGTTYLFILAINYIS
jgi:hypothetical protein